MRLEVISIFPDYFGVLQLSLIGKALADGLISLDVHDLRDYTHDRHRTTDDTPYGGGAGMVMKPEPWGEALDDVLAAADPSAPPMLIMPTPSGRPFTQAVADRLATAPHLVFACGRYEGIDARVAQWAATRMPVLELSLGDYVVNGGEVAALAMIEAIVRLVPGVLGNPVSLVEESYAASSDGLLEYPVYTKPPTWRGMDVPPVLLSGHHGQVAAWRRAQSEAITARRRPDLLDHPDAPGLP